MSTAFVVVRRGSAAAFGAAAMLIAGSGIAAADVTPGCLASDITAVESQVAAGMTAYLVTHPDVNMFFSGLKGLPTAEIARQTRAYLVANPQIQNEIDGVRAPVFDLRARCGVPINQLIGGVL